MPQKTNPEMFSEKRPVGKIRYGLRVVAHSNLQMRPGVIKQSAKNQSGYENEVQTRQPIRQIVVPETLAICTPKNTRRYQEATHHKEHHDRLVAQPREPVKGSEQRRLLL